MFGKQLQVVKRTCSARMATDKSLQKKKNGEGRGRGGRKKTKQLKRGEKEIKREGRGGYK